MLRSSTRAGLPRPALAALAGLILVSACAPRAGADAQAPTPRPVATAPDLSDRVEIVRTEYGIPHIFAEDVEAMGYALGWVQAEDYGETLIRSLIENRGEMGRTFGHDSIDSDFYYKQRHARARETFHLLDPDIRQIYNGFAGGVNRYILLHQDELPEWARAVFTGPDVLAGEVSMPSPFAGRRIVERLKRAEEEGDGAGTNSISAVEVRDHPDGRTKVYVDRYVDRGEEGSNAWALAPSRTTSGAAILVRNPHLSWDSGYYEGHVIVPGVVEWYGDFRMGGPFQVVGGFNRRLGFATTNNSGADTDEVYALAVDPDRVDHALFDGGSMPVERVEVTVEFKNGPGYSTETRAFWTTALGPVIWRGNGKVYVLRDGAAGEYRNGQQLFRMMQARSLEEWKQAMRMRGRASSNFTYADADGNIFYIWNTLIPAIPHEPGGDTTAVEAATSSGIWTRLIPWDSLPHLENPPGGYLHNENDPFHFANLNAVLRPEDFPPHFPEPRFRFRSQLSVELIGGDDRLSLEDVVARKHDMSMLLADRVKDDLVTAVRATSPTGDVAAAVDLVEAWDNTVSRDARGAMLFKTWWDRYVETADSASSSPASAGVPATPESLYEVPWSFERPASTPFGLADPARAADAFAWAVDTMTTRWDGYDVPWGEIHRARMGDKDYAVGGCNGYYGCFRVLWFTEDEEDGLLRVRGGDGWVVAVEFTQPVPRAYSILAYGLSPDPEHPYFANQLELFVNNEMKEARVAETDIRDHAIRVYRPGAP